MVNNCHFLARVEILKALLINIRFFWDMRPCILAYVFQRFGGTCWICLQDSVSSEMFVNSSWTLPVHWCLHMLPVYTDSYPRTLEISFSGFRSLFQETFGLDSPGNSYSPVPVPWNLVGEEVGKGEGKGRFRVWGQYLLYDTRCQWKILVPNTSAAGR